MSTYMLIACTVSVFIIERNTHVAFSLKIVSLIAVINIGFVLNQVFSMFEPHLLLSKSMQGFSYFVMGQYIPMGQIFTWRQWKLYKKY